MVTRKNASRGMPPLRIGLLTTEEAANAAMQTYTDEQHRRMVALADSLGIPDDTTRWYSVALHFAPQHAPELREEKPVGAPTKWGDVELGVLAVEIERERQIHGGGTVASAADSLSRREPWCSFLQEKSGTYMGPDAKAALVKAYEKAKRCRFTPLARKAYRRYVATEDVSEWDTDFVATIGQDSRK